MKIPKLLGSALLTILLQQIAHAQVTIDKPDSRKVQEGAVTGKSPAMTFGPELRTRVIKYFDTYKNTQYGLPPGFYTRVKVEQIPAGWRSARISPGLKIAEIDRRFLVIAPPELVQLLPSAATTNVRYYVAGGNVVAVDDEFRVVDSIYIPTAKFVVKK